MSYIEFKREETQRPDHWEQVNKTNMIFVTFDCEQKICLITASRKLAIKYCKENNCQYSEHPPGCYINHYIETDND